MNNIENLFFWETVAATAFFGALVIGIGLSMRLVLAGIKSYFQGHRKHKSVINTVNSLSGEAAGLRSEVIARFVEIAENSEFGMRSGFTPVLVDYVMEQLRSKFTVKSLSQMCSLNSKYCTQIVQATDEYGNVFLLGLSWSDRTLYDNKGRLLYTCDQNLDDFSYSGEEDESRIVVGHMTEIAFPIMLGENHDSVVQILNIVKEGEMKSVSYTDKTPGVVPIFKLQYDKIKGYSLQRSTQQTTLLPNKMLDLSYSDVNYDFGGKTHAMSMSKAIPVLVESLNLGENALIFGAPGTGKSYLLEQLEARLANAEDIRVIIMTPTQIRELQSSEAKTAFEAALASTTMKNIIVVDEGETLLKKSESGLHTDDNTIILQMMSGGLQKSLNCQLIIAFNAEPEQLNKALFRKGRAGIVIHLKPLPAEKANQLLQEVKKVYPDRIFDREQYRTTLNMSNLAVDKTVYAKPGYIILGDLYDAFPHKSKHAAITRALTIATGKPVEVTPAPVPAAPKEEVKGNRPPRKVITIPDAAAEAPTMVGKVSKHWNRRRK